MKNRLVRLIPVVAAGFALVANLSCAHKKKAEADEEALEPAPEAEIDPVVVENYFERSLLGRAKKLDFTNNVSRDDFMATMEVADPIGTLNSRGKVIDYWQVDDYTIEATVDGPDRSVSGVKILKKSKVVYEADKPDPELVDIAEPDLPTGVIPELPSQPVPNRFMRRRDGPLPAVGESPPPVTIIRDRNGNSRVVQGSLPGKDTVLTTPPANAPQPAADPFQRHLQKRESTEGGSGNR